MRNNVLKHIGVGLLFVFSQLLIFQYLTIFGAIVDPLLIFILWTTLKYQRFEVLLFAAGLGLFQDALFDIWGLNMFTKTVTVFLIYKVVARNPEVKLLFWQVFVIVLASATIHNVIYFAFSSFLDVYSSLFSPIILILGSSLYTAIVGSVLYILKGDTN